MKNIPAAMLLFAFLFSCSLEYRNKPLSRYNGTSIYPTGPTKIVFFSLKSGANADSQDWLPINFLSDFDSDSNSIVKAYQNKKFIFRNGNYQLIQIHNLSEWENLDKRNLIIVKMISKYESNILTLFFLLTLGVIPDYSSHRYQLSIDYYNADGEVISTPFLEGDQRTTWTSWLFFIWGPIVSPDISKAELILKTASVLLNE